MGAVGKVALLPDESSSVTRKIHKSLQEQNPSHRVKTNQLIPAVFWSSGRVEKLKGYEDRTWKQVNSSNHQICGIYFRQTSFPPYRSKLIQFQRLIIAFAVSSVHEQPLHCNLINKFF